jgi:thiamine-phosphate pyrophosphorylase
MTMFDAHILQLMAITDNLRDGVEGLVTRARAAERGGATCIQLRLKDAGARELLEVARRLVAELSIPLIVNDRLDVALAAGAAGAHLGADDLPIAAARSLLGTGFILGTSVGSDAEVEGAKEADYVGIGPVFSTPSKTDAGEPIGVEGMARLIRLCGKPAVGIGGIGPSNARNVIEAGATGIAVLGAAFGAADPERATRELASAIGR